MGEAIRANSGFVALFILGVLHLLEKVTFDWPVIVVFSIALLPQISRLIEYLKAGSEGVEMRMRAGSLPAKEVEGAVRPKEPAVMPQSDFAKLDDDEKRILKSLWHFQQVHFGAKSPTRWGFTVGAGMSDYLSFMRGAAGLLSKTLVSGR